MQAILTSFDRRWRRTRSRFAPLRWQAWLFIAANCILIAFILFDPLVGGHQDSISSPVRFLGSILTKFGESGWIIVVSLFLFFEGWAGARFFTSSRCRCQAAQISRIGGYLLLSTALSGIVANLLKRLIGRARPEHFHDWGIFGFSPLAGRAGFESFPSGHATTIGAFFAAMSFFFPRYRLAFVVCALWLAATRVMIGAHYPSDVVAGLILGSWFSFALAIVYSRYGLLFRMGDDNWPTLRRPISQK